MSKSETRRQIRRIRLDAEKDFVGLNQRQWNLLKSWMIRQEGVPSEKELIRQLLYEPGSFLDGVARLANSHGVENVVNAARAWRKANMRLTSAAYYGGVETDQ